VSGADLITNGGFEDPGGNGTDPTDWTLDSNSYGTFSGAAHSGNWGLHVGGNANSGGRYQDITATIGTPYVVSLWVENYTSATGTSHLDVLIGEPGDGSFTFTFPNDVNPATTTAYAPDVTDYSFVVGSATNGGWQQVEFTFTATATTTRFGIYNSHKTTDTFHSINVDDVSVLPGGTVSVSLAAAKQFDNPGADLVITATLTPGANQSQAVTVTVTNDNPAAVTLSNAVNNVLTLIFAAGATNVQSFTAHINAVGDATLTASGTGLLGAMIVVGGLPARTLVESFSAASTQNLNYGTTPNNGDAVSSWAGDINASTVAQQFAAGLPVFLAHATPAGTPAISFTNQGALFIPSDVSPVAGRTNFSMALVFRSYTNGSAAGQPWYLQTGIVDGDQFIGSRGGWGLSLDSNGVLNFGVGGPAFTLADGSNNVADAAWHIAVFASEATSSQLRISLDDLPTVVSTGATISGAPRDAYNIYLGKSSQYAYYFVGDFAELQFYDGALTAGEVTNLIHSLKTNYNILFASEVNIVLSATNPVAAPGTDVSVTAAIPLGKNTLQPVVVTVTNNNPGVVNLGGGSSLTLTFGAGGTNVQLFSAHIQALGSADLTANSPGLVPATLAVFGQVPLPSVDRVANGGFEIPGGNGNTPTDWNLDFNSYGTYSGAAHGGNWGLHAGNNSNSGGRYQDITTTIRSLYAASLWVENFGAAAGTSHLDVLVGEPGDGSFTFTFPNDVNPATTTAYATNLTDYSFVVGSDTNGGWQQVTFQFMAPGPTTRFGLYNSYKTNDTIHSINVDDVSVIPLPVPLGLQTGVGNIIYLYWPAGANGYVLQSSTRVDAGWADAGLPVMQQGDLDVVMDMIGPGAKFYRLHHP
jgi:hypothetical protein